MSRRGSSAKLLCLFLLLGVVFVASTSVGLTLAPTSVGGVWTLRGGINALKVESRTLQAPGGAAYSLDLDPDGAIQFSSSVLVGTDPLVHAGMTTSFRASGEPAAALPNDYWAYTYVVDLNFKTLAQALGPSINYEWDQVAVSLTFSVTLEGENPDGQISDVFIKEYSSGLTEYPGLTVDQYLKLFQVGADPARNVIPLIGTGQAAGEGLIREGAGTQAASCSISLLMKAGGAFSWSPGPWWAPWAATGVHVYNVYAVYRVCVEIVCKTPPTINPFAIILEILRDFGFRVMDLFDLWAQTLGLWLLLVVVAFLVFVGIVLLLAKVGVRRVRRKAKGLVRTVRGVWN